jgi:hypothetical protein
VIDQRDVEHAAERFRAPDGAFERLALRRDRKARDRRIRAGVVGLVIAIAVGWWAIDAIRSEPMPANDRGENPFVGTWVSRGDDGTQTITVSISRNGAIEIEVRDYASRVCSGTPSTMTGTGRIEDGTSLVVTGAFTCDDGSPPLQETIDDWTFVAGPRPDTLSDAFGSEWEKDTHAGAAPLWPQTSLEEVRRAQKLADAGDPDYAWQVTRDLQGQVGQNHPAGAEIFDRFLSEELGWERFDWEEAAAHPDGLTGGDVVYIRCAPDGTNPLYPTAPQGEDVCGPTIDDLRYETVKVTVAQLDRRDEKGIWVVTGWEEIEPFEQVAPPSDAEVTALLDAFLQARVDGAGAEALVDLAEYDEFADVRVDREIPLLYATSTGLAYERSEFDVAVGPVWPTARMQIVVRMFAGNGDVVEQRFTLRRDGAGDLRLEYDFGAEGPEGTATTENGKPLPAEYAFLDGQVRYRATDPAAPRVGTLWEQGPDVATVVGAGERRLLVFLADPRPIMPGCDVAPAPADAEALAQSIRSDTDFEAGAPVPTTIGGIPALQMDVVMAPQATTCPWQMPNLSSTTPLLLEDAPLLAQGTDRARLYLVDLPGGSAHVLAIAILSDRDSLEQALRLTAPIVDSIEFHAP